MDIVRFRKWDGGKSAGKLTIVKDHEVVVTLMDKTRKKPRSG
jgi:hypothetical protein